METCLTDLSPITRLYFPAGCLSQSTIPKRSELELTGKMSQFCHVTRSSSVPHNEEGFHDSGVAPLI